MLAFQTQIALFRYSCDSSLPSTIVMRWDEAGALAHGSWSVTTVIVVLLIIFVDVIVSVVISIVATTASASFSDASATIRPTLRGGESKRGRCCKIALNESDKHVKTSNACSRMVRYSMESMKYSMELLKNT